MLTDGYMNKSTNTQMAERTDRKTKANEPLYILVCYQYSYCIRFDRNVELQILTLISVLDLSISKSLVSVSFSISSKSFFNRCTEVLFSSTLCIIVLWVSAANTVNNKLIILILGHFYQPKI